METNSRWHISLLNENSNIWNTWEARVLQFQGYFIFQEAGKTEDIFKNFYTISNKEPCNHLTKGHLQEFSDEWLTNSCYYKRVFPKKGLRKWQRVCSWISWFRILPGKWEHQATDYSIAIRQCIQRKHNPSLILRVVKFQKQNSLYWLLIQHN